MIFEKKKKLQQTKKIQQENIHRALLIDHKLDTLKDKSKNLELKTKLFLESNEQIKKNKINLKKKWQLILLGGILFGLMSALLGLHWIYCLLNTISGALIGYGLNEIVHFINNIDLSDLPNPNLADLIEIEIEQVNQSAPTKAPTPIHPNFDKTIKITHPLQEDPRSKNSYAFKK